MSKIPNFDGKGWSRPAPKDTAPVDTNGSLTPSVVELLNNTVYQPDFHSDTQNQFCRIASTLATNFDEVSAASALSLLLRCPCPYGDWESPNQCDNVGKAVLLVAGQIVEDKMLEESYRNSCPSKKNLLECINTGSMNPVVGPGDCAVLKTDPEKLALAAGGEDYYAEFEWGRPWNFPSIKPFKNVPCASCGQEVNLEVEQADLVLCSTHQVLLMQKMEKFQESLSRNYANELSNLDEAQFHQKLYCDLLPEAYGLLNDLTLYPRDLPRLAVLKISLLSVAVYANFLNPWHWKTLGISICSGLLAVLKFWPGTSVAVSALATLVVQLYTNLATFFSIVITLDFFTLAAATTIVPCVLVILIGTVAIYYRKSLIYYGVKLLADAMINVGVWLKKSRNQKN